MGPQCLWVGLDPSPDPQPRMECSSIFSTEEGHRGLFSPPLPFAMNSWGVRVMKDPSWSKYRHPPTKQAAWFTPASGYTEDREDK